MLCIAAVGDGARHVYYLKLPSERNQNEYYYVPPSSLSLSLSLTLLLLFAFCFFFQKFFLTEDLGLNLFSVVVLGTGGEGGGRVGGREEQRGSRHDDTPERYEELCKTMGNTNGSGNMATFNV